MDDGDGLMGLSHIDHHQPSLNPLILVKLQQAHLLPTQLLPEPTFILPP